MKKLITVTWSVTIEADVPKGLHIRDLENKEGVENALFNSILDDAWLQVQKGDGEVTDIQD